MLQVSEVDKLHEWMGETQQLLEEADDHVRWRFHNTFHALKSIRFLGTIESSLDVIATTNDFDQVTKIAFKIILVCPPQISETIPNVTSSLRNIWLLSKCFNTDIKIHNLILMISQLINERVVDAIQLIEFKNPSSLQVKRARRFCNPLPSGSLKELCHCTGEVEEELLEDEDGHRAVSEGEEMGI